MPKKNLTMAQWEAIHEARHGGGVLIEELGEAALRTIRAMDADQKAHLRAKMNRCVGIAPKSSNGKPS
jgi:hypothetical protein